MATRAMIAFITDKPELISTYNHYDGYPENLGVGLDKYYSMPEEALKIASMGYISYLNPETGEIESKYKEPANRTSLPDDFQEAMFTVAEKGNEYGAHYIYIYNVESLEWINVSLGRGIRGAAEQLMNKLRDYDGGIFAPSGDINEDFNTKWKKFLNEESPLYNDMGEISDTIYDYADRMLGADVDDVEDLIMYYKNNPDEIPEPMDAKFFVQYADEIAQAVNDRERWENSDIDADF